MNIILDACAIIAFLRDEAGADVVREILLNADHTCMIHKESGTLLTSDRKEFEPVAVLNICPITFIR